MKIEILYKNWEGCTLAKTIDGIFRVENKYNKNDNKTFTDFFTSTEHYKIIANKQYYINHN